MTQIKGDNRSGFGTYNTNYLILKVCLDIAYFAEIENLLLKVL